MQSRRCMHNIEICGQCSKQEERRFTAAVDAMSALLSNQHVTKFYAHTDDAMKSIAFEAIEVTDALLAALEEKK